MNMSELWKDIAGYETLYQVSDLGNVRSLDRMVKHNVANSVQALYKQRILKPGKVNDYLRVVLSKEGKTTSYSVHRLVATSFLPNPENKPEVDHEDTDKSNNAVDNLRWATKKEHAKYNIEQGVTIRGENHGLSKFSNADAECIVKRLLNTSDSHSVISADYPISKATISSINTGRTWKHILPSIKRPIR